MQINQLGIWLSNLILPNIQTSQLLLFPSQTEEQIQDLDHWGAQTPQFMA